jgi:hypothetical protein
MELKAEIDARSDVITRQQEVTQRRMIGNDTALKEGLNQTD